MGRLIDADDVISLLANHHFDNSKENTDLLIHNLCKEVKSVPTAYEPDKVVEQLEKLKSLVPVNRILDDIANEKPKELGMLIAYRKAIEIVKGGGVDAKTDS